MIWYSNFWMRFFAALLYICSVKWICLKYYGPMIPYNVSENLPLEMDNKPIKQEKVLEIENLSKIEKTSYDRFRDYFSYFRYFPNFNDEEIPFTGILPDHDIFDSIKVDITTIERTRLFTVVPDNVLSETEIDPPPMLDSNLPFEIPVTITISQNISDSFNELIPVMATNDIQADMFNSIYGPSYVGPIIYSNDLIFNLHFQLVNHINSVLDEQALVDLKEAQRITHTIVENHMQQFNIYKDLTVQTLRDTQHIVNRLLEDLVVNAIFETDKRNIIIHLICKAIIFEAISHIEYLDNIDDLDKYRYEQTIARFLPQ